MFGALIDFVFGYLIGSGVANTRRTARNSAQIAKFAAMTESQKVAFQKQEQYLAGERRFILITFAVILAVGWALGALFGGN